MAVEGPSEAFVVPFGGWFANVVKYCCPAQPEVVAFLCHVVEDSQCMVKIIFVTALPNGFYSFQSTEFGEDDVHQIRLVQ